MGLLRVRPALRYWAEPGLHLAGGGGCVPHFEDAGAVAQGVAFTHPADGVIAWTQTAIPSSGFTRVRFRAQDASNHWHVRIDNAGAISLWEQVATVFTVRGSHAGPVLAGERIVVVAEGTTIDVYVNDVLLITYASAVNFATETDGSPYSLGVGGAISDLRTWTLACKAEEGV